MKTLCAFAALVLTLGTFSPASSRAQGSGMALENWKDILLGPMFEAGASVNAGPILDGYKTSPKFAFSGGAMLTYPWSIAIALDLTVCYDSRAVNFHPLGSDNGGVNLNYGYLAIRPEFRLGGFLIGLGLGLPVGVSITDSAGTLVSGGPSTTDMNFLVEGRIGGDINIWSNDKQQVHLMIGASYPFNKILKPRVVGEDVSHNNGPIATGELGICYMFDMNPH